MKAKWCHSQFGDICLCHSSQRRVNCSHFYVTTDLYIIWNLRLLLLSDSCRKYLCSFCLKHNFVADKARQSPTLSSIKVWSHVEYSLKNRYNISLLWSKECLLIFTGKNRMNEREDKQRVHNDNQQVFEIKNGNNLNNKLSAWLLPSGMEWKEWRGYHSALLGWTCIKRLYYWPLDRNEIHVSFSILTYRC